MNESPYSIVFRTPELLAIFGVLIAIELVWCCVYRKKAYGADEAAASVGIAIGRAFAKVLIGLVLGGLFLSVYDLRLLDIDMSDWKAWLALFLGADFLYYWMHRFKHEIRWMWADHAGNYLNFFINYRLGWTGLIVGTWLVYLPLVWIGFPPATVVSVFALSLVWQFWVHTDMIGKLGPLEWVLNTPSQPPRASCLQPNLHRQEPCRYPDHLGPHVRHLPGGAGGGAMRVRPGEAVALPEPLRHRLP